MKSKKIKKEVIKQEPVQKKQEPKVSEKKHSVNDTSSLFDKYLSGKHFYLFLGISLLIGIIVYGDFLSLNSILLYKDIGSDSFNIFYSSWVHNADYVRSDGIISKWSFSQGMGQNLFGGYLFFLTFPQNWILTILGSDNLAFGIVWQQFITIILAGIFFYFYLRTINLSYFSSIIGGMLYTFSGYIILGSSGWYGMPWEGMYLSLLLLSFELLFKKKRWWLFPVAVFFLGGYNTIFYSIFLFIYCTFRFYDEYGFNPKNYVILLLKMAGLGFIGILISASSVLPGWLNLYESPRFAGDASYFNILKSQPVFWTPDKFEYITDLMRAFSSDMLGTGNEFQGTRNYLEAPLFYAGLINLLLFPQIFAFLNNRKKILYLVLLLICFIPMLFPYFRYAFFFFAGDYWRIFSLFVAVILIYLSISGLNQIVRNGKANLIILLISLGVLLLALYYPYFPVGTPINKGLRGFATMFLIIYAGLIYLHNFKKYIIYAQIGLLLFIGIELSYFSFITVNKRKTLSSEEFKQKVGYNDYSKDAVQYIKSIDNSFYRIEKDYFSSPAMHGSLNDAKVHNYYGTSSYSSFNQLYYINFLQEVDIIKEGNETQTRWAPGLKGRPLLETFGSVKYYLSKGDGRYQTQVGYEPIAAFENVTVYKNKNYLPLGFCYDKYMTFSDFKKLSNLQKDISLLRSFIVDDKDKNSFIDFGIYTVSDTTANYTFDQFNYDIASIRKDTLTIVKHNHNVILGKINLKQKKLLFFSIPFDMGWTAKVNGKDVEPKLASIGFIGIPLEAGEHKIKLEFKPRFATLGNILSGLGIIIYIGMIFYFWKVKKQKIM